MKKRLLPLGALVLCNFTTIRDFANPISPEQKKLLNKNAIVFTENKGQVADDHGIPNSNVLFFSEANGTTVYLDHTGIHYIFKKIIADKSSSSEKMIKAGQQLSKIKYQKCQLDMLLLNCNKNASVIAQKPVQELKNYYLAHYFPCI